MARSIQRGICARSLCILLLALGMSACGEEASPTSASGAPSQPDRSVGAGSTSTAATSPEVDPLTGIEWQLVEMVISGRTVAVDEVDAVLRFDGAGGYSANACNFLEGQAEIGDGTLVLEAGVTTDMFCDGLPGEIDDALHSMSGSTVTWSVVDAELVLASAAGTTLRYRERDSIYPDAGNREVVAGERAGWQYRLSVTSDGGQLSAMNFVSRSGPGVAWGEQSHGAPSLGEAPLWSIVVGDVAVETFVAGFVPLGAVSATHQATSAAPPVSLEIYDVDDSQWAVIGGFVPEHSPASVISVYDASGAVIAEWRHA